MDQLAGSLKEKGITAIHRQRLHSCFIQNSDLRSKLQILESIVDVVKKQQQLSEMLNSLSYREKQSCISKVVMQTEKYEKDVLNKTQRERLMVKRSH